MAISVTPVTQQFSGTTFGTGAFTTSAFTPPNNCLLVIFVQILINASIDPGSGDTPTDSLGGGALTYSNRAQSHYGVAFSQAAICWTAPVTTGASMTITLNDGAQSVYQYVITVAAVTGYDTGTPIGGNAVTTADIGDGAETLTLSAAPATGDVTFVFVGVDDSNSGAANPTMGTGSYTGVYDAVSTLAACLKYRTAATSTSVPITDVYTGAGAFDKALAMAIVIKAGAGGVDASANAVTATVTVDGNNPTDITPPGAPTGLTTTPGNTTMDLSWTAPSDNGGSALTDYTVQYRVTP